MTNIEIERIYLKRLKNDEKIMKCLKDAVKNRDWYLTTREWEKDKPKPSGDQTQTSPKDGTTIDKNGKVRKKKPSPESPFKGITNVELSNLLNSWIMKCSLEKSDEKDAMYTILLSIFRKTQLHKDLKLAK